MPKVVEKCPFLVMEFRIEKAITNLLIINIELRLSN